MIIGIDASNIRIGGGVHHLFEILRLADPVVHNFSKIIVWASNSTLNQIEDREWLVKMHIPVFESHFIYRLLWQRIDLSR